MKKGVLLKLSGELFKSPGQIKPIIEQIKKLPSLHFSLVMGGGNFFRGAKEGKVWNLRRPTGDAIGMLATVMNGLILHDLLLAEGLASTVLSACPISGIVPPISQDAIDQAKATGSIIIFVSGTGTPFFTTDTTSVVRALQVNAQQVWKATNVDFVYDDDPAVNPKAQALKQVSYDQVIARKLKIMDLTAMTLAQQHGLIIRVFNGSTQDALIRVAQETDFGSTICT